MSPDEIVRAYTEALSDEEALEPPPQRAMSTPTDEVDNGDGEDLEAHDDEVLLDDGRHMEQPGTESGV